MSLIFNPSGVIRFSLFYPGLHPGLCKFNPFGISRIPHPASCILYLASRIQIA